MMKLKIGAGFAALFVTSLALGAFDGFTIKYSPKVGDVHKYKQVGKFDVGGMEIDFTSVSNQKIVKVEATGGYSVKEDVSETKINGADAPEGQGPSGNTTTYSAKGEVTKIESERMDDTNYRFANLSLFILPDKALNAGDSWTYDIKANKANNTVAGAAKYTLVGEDKVGSTDALKVKFSIKEAGDGAASSEGTLWITKSDGTLLKLNSKWLNAPVQGGFTISGDITVTLVQ